MLATRATMNELSVGCHANTRTTAPIAFNTAAAIIVCRTPYMDRNFMPGMARGTSVDGKRALAVFNHKNLTHRPRTDHEKQQCRRVDIEIADRVCVQVRPRHETCRRRQEERWHTSVQYWVYTVVMVDGIMYSMPLLEDRSANRARMTHRYLYTLTAADPVVLKLVRWVGTLV